MADSEQNTLVRFYAGEIKLDNLRFESIWFARCKGMQDQHTIATLREKLVEDALKLMIPNMHMLCVIYVCLPVTTCEAERSLACYEESITSYEILKHKRLNHCSILAIHRELTQILTHSLSSSLIRLLKGETCLDQTPNRFSFLILFPISAIQLNNRLFINTIN